MSYNVRITAQAGKVEVQHVSGDVPDGVFTISGHRDFSVDSFAVSIQDVNGGSRTASRSDYVPAAQVPSTTATTSSG